MSLRTGLFKQLWLIEAIKQGYGPARKKSLTAYKQWTLSLYDLAALLGLPGNVVQYQLWKQWAAYK